MDYCSSSVTDNIHIYILVIIDTYVLIYYFFYYCGAVTTAYTELCINCQTLWLKEKHFIKMYRKKLKKIEEF